LHRDFGKNAKRACKLNRRARHSERAIKFSRE
jgi:hypothetical protein